MQLLQEAVVSVRMRSMDYEQVSRRLGEEVERKLLSPNATVGVQRRTEIAAERIAFLLRSNE